MRSIRRRFIRGRWPERTKRGGDPAAPLTAAFRREIYQEANGTDRLTPAQSRRLRKKANRNG